MSKLIKIIHTEVDYRRGLAELLMKEGSIPVVFEVPDNFDVNSYDGLEAFSQDQGVAKSFTIQFPELAAWISAYNGHSPFYQSLKEQFLRRGMLSDKQIACLQKAVEQDKALGNQTPGAAPQKFSIEAGTVVVVTKFIANRIAEKAGCRRSHRALEVLEIQGETEKAYLAKVRFSAKRTHHCGVCGMELENPESIAAGVGPVCAENWGIPYGEGALDALAQKLEIVEVVCWIPKKCIKERSDQPFEKKPEAEEAEQEREVS